MSKKIKKEIGEQIVKTFHDYSLSTENAPQGSNSFCTNFLIKNHAGKIFLVKAVELGNVNKDTLKQTKDSISATRELRSQFFVPLIEVRETSDYIFMVFPFLSGKNLSNFIQSKNRLSEKEVIEIGISLLRGVADMARANVTHQDLKPDNVFITDSGEVKILDFGSSRYRQSAFRGSTKKNRHYSSPEQILGVRPINVERLKLTIDERSDVYSVGVILYEMITGKIPFDTIEKQLNEKVAQPIERTDISEGLKQIISRFLNYHPRNRPSAAEAVSFLEKGNVTQISLPRGEVYYSSSVSISSFVEASSLDDTLFKGIILRASKIPISNSKYLANGPLMTIVDPEAYIFQTPVHSNKKFKKLPYYRYGVSKDGDLDIGNVKTNDLEAFIKDVFKYELSTGADIVIPPFFTIKETSDISWTLDQEITNQAQTIYKSEVIQVPLFKGVAISENVLTTDITRGLILDYLTSPTLKGYSGYYVLFGNGIKDEILTNEPWLRSVKEFIIKLLATGKTVIWGQSSLAGIVFAGQPGLSIALGECQSQRIFYLPNQKSRGGRGSPHIYCPKMFARIKWPIVELLRESGKYDEMICLEKCCQGVDFRNPTKRDASNLATHFIFSLGKQFKKYSDGGLGIAKNDLKHAQATFSYLKHHKEPLVQKAVINEIKPSTTTFIDTWLDTF